MPKRYRAIFLPDDKDKQDYTKSGFNSEDETKQYIFQLFCETCKKSFDNPEEANCWVEWEIESYEE